MTPDRPTPRTARGAPGVMREAILRAGLTTIGDRGYRHATTREICRRAGVSSGTFFHYFPTKADLLLALLDRGEDQPAAPDLRAFLDEVVAEAADPVVRAFVREVSTLADVPGLAEVLEAEETGRRARLVAALETERAAGRAGTAVALEEQVRRVELLVAGYESLVATSEVDARALGRTLHEMARLTLATLAP
ncbi:TetR/AcrR family transcriptional regulator [Janibacter melonis]|uniref:TetR/AcrR family transcriptional regulator n=2 Tax=Janibacter melonis TaxID=262209 RepID=UPI001E4642A9|nr:TetR/AcrR family transcriptional regulator [Janibacter melonis]MCB5991359.1 TetR/AcrR family transcriptional regulator [Janibacter melonis]